MVDHVDMGYQLNRVIWVKWDKRRTVISKYNLKMTLNNTRPPKRWQCPSPLDKRAHAQIFQIREFLIGRGQSWAIVGNRGQWTLDIPPPHQPRSFLILNTISLSASSVRIVGNYSSLTDQRLFLLIAIVNTSNSRRGIYVLWFCKVTCLYRFQE